ncbi:MAG: adenylate kinase [Bacteroidota bacterium]|nr:adenylate kinase [Bacteroidota bacterium]
MLNIALFGPPGAGKGTQSKYLIDKYNLHYISTGDLLRRELKKESELGLQAKSIIEQGGLVSDEIIVQIIEKTIKENTDSNGFLFDGFPRTYVQAYILDGLMIKLNTTLHRLISIKVTEEESITRLLSRGEKESRSDDNKEVIKNRLQEYNNKTIPVLSYYKEKGIFTAVNGMQAVKSLTTDISKVINEELSKNLFNIVMFGAPGSGRSSQGKALAKKFDLEYIAPDSIAEEEMKQNTEIGKKIAKVYEKGDLIPDEIIIPLIEKKIKSAKGAKGFIFKGYPGTLVQSYILDGILKKQSSHISKIIEIEVETLELIKRMSARAKTKDRMPYDISTDKIIQHLQDHKDKAEPVIKKYKEIHDVYVVDGKRNKDVIFEELSQEIENSFDNLS